MRSVHYKNLLDTYLGVVGTIIKHRYIINVDKYIKHTYIYDFKNDDYSHNLLSQEQTNLWNCEIFYIFDFLIMLNVNQCWIDVESAIVCDVN